MQQLITNYSAFNLWANQKIVEWLGALDAATLQAEVQSSFTSIDFTLQHMLRTERFWLAFISGGDVQGFDWSVRTANPAITMQQLLEKSEELKSVFSNYTSQQLIEVLHLNMPWANNALPRYEYIMHVINHSTYHRGQIVTIARMLGINDGIPATDYNIYNCR